MDLMKNVLCGSNGIHELFHLPNTDSIIFVTSKPYIYTDYAFYIGDRYTLKKYKYYVHILRLKQKELYPIPLTLKSFDSVMTILTKCLIGSSSKLTFDKLIRSHDNNVDSVLRAMKQEITNQLSHNLARRGYDGCRIVFCLNKWIIVSYWDKLAIYRITSYIKTETNSDHESDHDDQSSKLLTFLGNIYLNKHYQFHGFIVLSQNKETSIVELLLFGGTNESFQNSFLKITIDFNKLLKYNKFIYIRQPELIAKAKLTEKRNLIIVNANGKEIKRRDEGKDNSGVGFEVNPSYIVKNISAFHNFPSVYRNDDMFDD